MDDLDQLFNVLIEHQSLELKRLEALELIAIRNNDANLYLKASNQKAKILSYHFDRLSKIQSIYRKFVNNLLKNIFKVNPLEENKTQVLCDVVDIIQKCMDDLHDGFENINHTYADTLKVDRTIFKKLDSIKESDDGTRIEVVFINSHNSD